MSVYDVIRSSVFPPLTAVDGDTLFGWRALSMPVSGKTPLIDKHHLVNYLRNGESAEPDMETMTSPGLRQLQQILIVLLHDYWLQKYITHLHSARWSRMAPIPTDILQLPVSEWSVVDPGLCGSSERPLKSAQTRAQQLGVDRGANFNPSTVLP
jgi:hypothetical protein